MKVSIVIPAHNEEKRIAAAISAALNQDYPDYEIIVVDNASNDRTHDVAEKIAATSNKVKVVYEHRKGLLWARERGRQEASGEIIANMDSDCQPDHDWLTRGVSLFTSSDIVLVSGPYDYHDATPFFRYSNLYFQKMFYSATGEVTQALGVGAVIFGGNNFIRTSALEKVGGYTTSIAFWGEDVDTAKKLSKVGRVYFSNNLEMKTSARRYVEHGWWDVFSVYVLNFFWVLIFHKPYEKSSAKKVQTREDNAS